MTFLCEWRRFIEEVYRFSGGIGVSLCCIGVRGFKTWGLEIHDEVTLSSDSDVSASEVSLRLCGLSICCGAATKTDATTAQSSYDSNTLTPELRAFHVFLQQKLTCC